MPPQEPTLQWSRTGLPALLSMSLLVPVGGQDPIDSPAVYHQVTEVRELQGRVKLWTASPVRMDIAKLDDDPLPDQFACGFRIEFSQITRHSKLLSVGPSDPELSEPKGTVLAAVSLPSPFGQEVLCRTLHESVTDKLVALEAQQFGQPWTGLRPSHFFVNESLVPERDMQYLVLMCVQTTDSSRGTVWKVQVDDGVFGSRMHSLGNETTAAVCGTLATAFDEVPDEIESERVPAEIRGRLIRASYVDNTGAPPATLPEGARLGSLWEPAASDAARSTDSEERVRVSRSAKTPDTELDPDSFSNGSSLLARYTVFDTIQSFGPRATHQERPLDSLLVAWVLTAEYPEPLQDAIEKSLAKRLAQSTEPLTVEDLARHFTHVPLDQVFVVLCRRDESGRTFAHYAIGSKTGLVLNPRAVCSALEEQLGVQ